jgi:hypothetical protein
MLTRNDRDAIDGLFERLADAEARGEPRDRDAEALIAQKIARQPAAPYYLAQTVVVQKDALEQAERRIEELEAQLGRGQRQIGRQRGPWDGQQPAGYGGGWGYGGGGFLAGAAQTALGVAGGVLLGSMIGGLFSPSSAHAAETSQDSGSADSGNSSSDSSDAGSDGGDLGGFDGGDGGFDVGGDF